MNISREEAIRKHREMWNWIADQYEERRAASVERLKRKFIEKHYPDDRPNSNCYCCEYSGDFPAPMIGSPLYNCIRCPLKWPSLNKTYMCLYATKSIEPNGLYGKVVYYTNLDILNYKKAAAITREIANLPERKIKEE